jgi:hypothetical protein
MSKTQNNESVYDNSEKHSRSHETGKNFNVIPQRIQ